MLKLLTIFNTWEIFVYHKIWDGYAIRWPNIDPVPYALGICVHVTTFQVLALYMMVQFFVVGSFTIHLGVVFVLYGASVVMDYYRFMRDGTQTEGKLRDEELYQRLVTFNSDWKGGVTVPLYIAFWVTLTIWLAFIGREHHIHPK